MAFNSRQQVPHVKIMEDWSEFFDLRDVRREDDHRINFLGNRLVVSRDDIKTARLTETVTFYRSMQSRDIPVLPGCPEHLNDVLDIFARLATFDNLTRGKFAPTRAPIFWVRTRQAGPFEIARRKSAPVLPLGTASAMCGIDQNRLRANLGSLVRDGAVGWVKSPDGISGIHVRDGFIIDNGFRKYYRT